MSISAYPLTWPATFPRKQYRETGKFKTSIASALNNVQDSLRKFATDSGKKLDNLVISSNVTLGAQKPADPGVAVWFSWDGLQVCIAVDRYTSVESNLQAIHHIIEARRVELRHGTLALVRATFQGFVALPAPPVADWRTVLGLSTNPGHAWTVEHITQAYRLAASKAHPDKHGGSTEAMQRVNAARDEALREIGR